MIRSGCYIFLFFSHIIGSTNANCDISSETVASGTYYEPRDKLCAGDLIFEDNFNTFDLARWQHEITLAGGGNWEFEYYGNNRTNSFAKNGFLHVRPTFLADDTGEGFLYSGTLDINGGAPADICTNAAFYGCRRTGSRTNIINPIKSARIRTVESFSFRYGVVVVRAKMPAGDWLWPAVWLLPRYDSYGSWPASGEIDLLESRGNRQLKNPSGVNVGTQQIASTLHWGPTFYTNQYYKTHFEKNNKAGYDNDFHIYKLVWNSNEISFHVDNKKIGTVSPPKGGFWEKGGFPNSTFYNPWKGGSKMAPFDQEFYLIINLAVGGTNFFADDYTNPGGKPWKNNSPQAATDFWQGRNQWEPTWNRSTDDTHLIVDYVKVYAV